MHWANLCIKDWAIFSSGNCLSPAGHQAITWVSVDLLWIRPFVTNRGKKLTHLPLPHTCFSESGQHWFIMACRLIIQHQAIIWTSAVLLSIGPLGKNCGENSTKIQNVSFTKMHLKISSAKRRPSCPGGDELNQNQNIFIQENIFENIICKISAILSLPLSTVQWTDGPFGIELEEQWSLTNPGFQSLLESERWTTEWLSAVVGHYLSKYCFVEHSLWSSNSMEQPGVEGFALPHMMMSWNGNTVSITGSLWGEVIGSPHKGSVMPLEAFMFPFPLAITSCWINSQDDNSLRSHDAHVAAV